MTTLTEKKATHTPGPWDLIHLGSDGAFEIGKLLPNGYTECVIVSREAWNHRVDECHANARVIAAAPELLTELRRLRRVIEVLALDPVDSDYRSIIEPVDALLARINGEPK